jgi:hypothetical protein
MEWERTTAKEMTASAEGLNQMTLHRESAVISYLIGNNNTQ